MSKYKVEITGVNTSNLESIDSNTMKKLFIKCKNGDMLSRDMLIEGNLKLSKSFLWYIFVLISFFLILFEFIESAMILYFNAFLYLFQASL